MAGIDRRDFLKISSAFLALGATAGLGGCKDKKQKETPAIEEPFKIGGIGAVSGVNSTYGIPARFGAQVAVDEINARGTRRYELNWQDDKDSPQGASRSYGDLRDWGAQVIIGPLTTNCALSVAQDSCRDKVFQLLPTASSVDVLSESYTTKEGLKGSTRRSNIFQTCCSNQVIGEKAAEVIASRFSDASVGVVYNDISAYSTGVVKSFKDAMKSYGLEIVAYEKYGAESIKSFQNELIDARDKGVDFLFMPIYAYQAARILEQANELEYKPQFMGADGIDGILTVEGFPSTLAEDMIVLTTFAADDLNDKTQLFVEKYKQLVDGAMPNQFAADAYDCIYVLDKLISLVGKIDMEDQKALSKRLEEEILKPDFVFTGLTGKDITWSQEGVCTKTANAMVIRGGDYVMLEG